MKVIFVKELRNIGKKDDVKEVADGFATNYLIPGGYAVKATTEAIKELKARQDALARKKAKAKEAAEADFAKLNNGVVIIPAKVGPTGKLFGSITPNVVATVLNKDYNILISKKDIDMPDAITSPTQMNIKLKLYEGVIACMTLVVKAEE